MTERGASIFTPAAGVVALAAVGIGWESWTDGRWWVAVGGTCMSLLILFLAYVVYALGWHRRHPEWRADQ